MAACPVEHWQTKSVREQPDAPMAVTRQVVAQAGRAAWSPAMEPVCAETREAKMAMTAVCVNCMLRIY